MRLLLTLTMLGCTCALTACAGGRRPLRGPVPLEWRSLVGCYRLTERPGPPRSFALDSTSVAATFGEGARSARSSRVMRPGDLQDYWLVTDRNTVVYVDHEGWGATMEFVVRGDSLVGTHRNHSHVIGWEFEPVRAAAVRESCPAGTSS